MLVERTAAEVKIYDTSTLPPVLRSLPASQVRRIRTRKGRSPMPGGWDKVYSADELQAIVAFLGRL